MRLNILLRKFLSKVLKKWLASFWLLILKYPKTEIKNKFLSKKNSGLKGLNLPAGLFILSLVTLQSVWFFGVSLVAQLVKTLPAMQETLVCSLGWEDPLEQGKATHSSILAWRIPGTVQSMGSQSQIWLSDFHFHFLFSLVCSLSFFFLTWICKYFPRKTVRVHFLHLSSDKKMSFLFPVFDFS